MDHYSAQLMDDIVLEARGSPKPNSSKSNAKSTNSKTANVNVKSTNPPIPPKDKPKSEQPTFRSLKVEMQTLRVSQESEKQLYDTLKHIHGSGFRLANPSEFENKNTNLGKQYWLQRGNLIIKGITNYSAKEAGVKSHEQITRDFATSKLETYNFHASHCAEALAHTEGHMGKALELLFYKYYGIENLPKKDNFDGVDLNDLLQRRQEEKEALESIYGDSFKEKIKNQIWIFNVKLDYLVKTDEDKKIKSKPKPLSKDICRLYLQGKCRFGIKCRFLHQQPEPAEKPKAKIDSMFTLEIRFPDDCKYPYEPPYFYFYKSDGTFPALNSLRIARRLHNEALTFCEDGIPSMYSVISLLENEEEILSYLSENKEFFLDQDDPLFAKSSEIEKDGPTHYKKGSTNKKNRDEIAWDDILRQDIEIKAKFMNKQKNPHYLKMKDVRRKLPAWSKMNEVLETIHENQVTIISGETGCGKSTQVPQFILDDWIINMSEESKEHVEIVCTQPRRISAIGVAERVAAERDERIGNTIGYQIRLESKVSSNTRLTFCTTGILLQRLSGDPQLKSVTHIIVDEVHERSAESDFLLMLLKKLLRQRRDLKVILMSATLKSDIFSTYFGGVPVLDIPGRTFPVTQFFLEDILEMSNYVLEENSKYTRKIKGGWEQLNVELETADAESLATVAPKNTILDENLTLPQIMGRYSDYSRSTHKNLYVMDHEKINFELIERVIEWIVDGDHDYPRSGSILVFLPGIAEIMSLKDLLNDNRMLSPKSGKFLIIPLHSTLSSEEQSLVFKRPKPGVRKIVLSTNIAETSVTIDDCVFVIDTGKMKETRFNSNQNMESLEMCWVSRANALQRKGRAGRVMSGVCIHLYTSYRFNYSFLAQPIPEILRISLEPLLLRIKILHKSQDVDLYQSLGKLLEPPAQDSISTAIKRLQDVGAFDPESMLTPLGHHLAALPVDVRIGKLILFGAIFCCVDSALTIAACLSHKSPFVVPFDKKYEVNAKKKEYATANSDQLTTLKAYRKWLEISAHGYLAGQTFANANFLSVRTLQTLADIKHQLLELLVSIGFVPVNIRKRPMGQDKILEVTGQELNTNNENYNLLQGLLCAALYPNVVKVFTPEKSFQMQSSGAIPRQPKPEELRFQTKEDGMVNIHPSSINFSVGYYTSPYLVFQEKIKTSRIFIREVTMVPMLALVLFSGYGIDIELHNGTFILSLGDGWIMFAVESHRVAQLLQYARVELIKLLEQKMEDPLLNLVNHPHGRKIIRTIVNVVTNG
ncbi:putative ATP-dependent RNA helicase DHX57 [Nasonia vitripennis]|uniref:RNA helicase n=1 Tax=Nasonia vitripennis TaxID=7425 RepID=A0A7M7GEF9_NASVI|nr:putative ATP-dependent RNA helicase DHX57 [Nasonia vitripennis]